MNSRALGEHARRYRWLAFAILLVLTIPRMAGRTMFGDGMLYATIARNMSVGDGTLWAPSFTATTYPEFFEHPPLGFAFQAVAFGMFGDHLLVERAYALVLFMAQAVLIMAIWRRLLPGAHDWLPLLFWVAPSIVTWAVINNMLENTQALFTTGAVYLVLRAMASEAPAHAASWSAAAGACVVAAVLTKGPVGFFPLAVPLLAGLLPLSARSGPRGLVAAVMLAVVVFVGMLLVSYSPAHRAVVEYVEHQLVPSLAGLREVNDDPWSAAKHLGFGLWVRMAVLVAIIRFSGRPARRDSSQRIALFFLTVGLAASVPIAISPKMVGHYFLPSVSMYAIGFAAFAQRFLRSAAPDFSPSLWARRVPVALAAILLVASIGLPIVKGPLRSRDVSFLASLDAVGPVVPRESTIGACAASGDDWRLHTYFHRFFRVSLDATGMPGGGWFLRAADGCQAPAQCAVAVEAPAFSLFDCRADSPAPR